MNETESLPPAAQAARDRIRAGQPNPDDVYAQLQTSWAVQPPATKPGIGSLKQLADLFRALWSRIATRWYLLPLVDQQNRFNALVVQQLNHQKWRLEDDRARLEDYDAWLVAQDREAAEQARQTTVLVMHLRRLNQRLEALDRRLAALEAAPDTPGES